MPFKSESQRRYFHVMEDKGEIAPKVVHEWEHATPKKVKKNLPYHVKQSEMSAFVDELEKISAVLLKRRKNPRDLPESSTTRDTTEAKFNGDKDEAAMGGQGIMQGS